MDAVGKGRKQIVNNGSGEFPLSGRKEASMWLLLIILLSNVPALNKVTILQRYATEQDCQMERNRVGFAMAEAYPYERDFVIACHLDEKHES